MEPVASFIGRRGILFLGVNIEERGVEVDRDVTLWRCGPDDLPCLCHGLCDRTQLGSRRGLHRPPGCRHRRDLSEQLGLLPQGVDVAQAVGSIGNGDSEMGEDHARIVGVPRDAAVGHRLRQRVCQPSAIGELRPDSIAVPACETRLRPSVVTSARRTERLRCTFKEASSWVG